MQLYDLDREMRVERRGTQRALIATLDQRDNFLRVLHTYYTDSLADGYASPRTATREVKRNAKARDRARAYQLWEHGVINISTLRKIFPVTRRTMNTYWGINSRDEDRLRLWGSLNPEHIPYLLQLLDLRRKGEAIALRSEAILHLTGPIDPDKRTNLALAANMLGLNLRGMPLPDIGLDDAPVPPVGPDPQWSTPRVPTLPPFPHVPVPGQTTVEDHLAAATDLRDPEVRASVELGEQAFAPDMTDFDDTGDEVLAALHDDLALSDVGEDVYEGDPGTGERG